jgi:hypothetical protein
VGYTDEELSEAIRRYLAEHPFAMDTLDGIAEWWVMRDQVRTDVEAVARVLDHLVRNGELEQLGSPDSPRYRLANQPRRSP